MHLRPRELHTTVALGSAVYVGTNVSLGGQKKRVIEHTTTNTNTTVKRPPHTATRTKTPQVSQTKEKGREERARARDLKILPSTKTFKSFNDFVEN